MLRPCEHVFWVFFGPGWRLGSTCFVIGYTCERGTWCGRSAVVAWFLYILAYIALDVPLFYVDIFTAHVAF